MPVKMSIEYQKNFEPVEGGNRTVTVRTEPVKISEQKKKEMNLFEMDDEPAEPKKEVIAPSFKKDSGNLM